MKSWYENRMESGVSHRGQAVAKGKKVYLTEAQAKLHNRTEEKLVKCDSPKAAVEAAVKADYDESEQANASNKSKSEKQERKAERQRRQAAE